MRLIASTPSSAPKRLNGGQHATSENTIPVTASAERWPRRVLRRWGFVVVVEGVMGGRGFNRRRV
jgi:hypothetical protein